MSAASETFRFRYKWRSGFRGRADAKVELFAAVAGLGQFQASRRGDFFRVAAIPGRGSLELQRTVQSLVVVVIDNVANRFL